MAIKIKGQDQKELMDTSYNFSTPIYRIEKPEWLLPAIKATDKYIKKSEQTMQQETLKERKKFLGNKDYLKVKDHGLSYHSTSLNGDPEL